MLLIWECTRLHCASCILNCIHNKTITSDLTQYFSFSSSHLPTLSTTFSSKPHINLKLPHFPFISKRNLGLLSRKASENGEASVGSVAAAIAVEEVKKVEKKEASLGSNGAAHVAVKEPGWVGGTWDLKQFEKNGKTNWDSVVDAGIANLALCLTVIMDNLVLKASHWEVPTILRNMCVNCTTVKAGAEAIELFQSGAYFDLVLIDICFESPQMRSMGIDCMIVGITVLEPERALRDQMYIHAFMEVGLDDHVQKPGCSDNLVPILGRINNSH